MSQSISNKTTPPVDMLKYGSIISAAIFGSVLFGYFIYYLVTHSGGGGGGGGSTSKTYKKSLSLDKLYDEAGGNDPLSDSVMTSQIDLSTENNSCSFMVSYKGVRDRTVECIRGCNEDEDDDNSNFCKQFEYPGGDSELKDTFLDQTYTRRRGDSNIRNNSATED